jgi:aspartate-semialdehyde dehydrogenase
MFWNVADNVRVGAATNAVRIMQKHIELNDWKICGIMQLMI